MRTISWVGTTALTLALGASTALAQVGGAQFGVEAAGCDFNGDGYADVAVGGNEAIMDGLPAGKVYVRYGRPSGFVRDVRSRLALHQGTLGVGFPPQGFAWFGGQLGKGDFNSDGFCDLAVGASQQSFAGAAFAGLVNVIYGSAQGLVLPGTPPATAPAPKAFTQADLGEDVEVGDQLGQAFASADFNGDGHADLAVGAAGETLEGNQYAGVVHVVYGSPAGLQTLNPPPTTLSQKTLDGPGEIEPFDFFGSELASGDFDADGFGDLAVGAPYESDPDGSGRVTVLYGHPQGLGGDPARSRQIDESDIEGPGTRGAHGFALALASGDFDDDGFRDLAIGNPGDEDSDETNVGTIHVLFGSAAGLSTSRYQLFGQDMPAEIADQAEAWDAFGTAVAAGDFDDDGIDDLAVGAPGEGADPKTPSVGLVHLLRGSPEGLTAAGNQAIPGYDDRLLSGPEFGYALAPGDFDGNGIADVCIGSPLGNGPGGTPYVGTAKVVLGGVGTTQRLYPW